MTHFVRNAINYNVMSKTIVSIYLDPDLIERLLEDSEADERTLSGQIRKIIKDYYEER